MKAPVTLHLSRVCSVAKAALAVIGVVAVFGFTFAPMERHPAVVGFSGEVSSEGAGLEVGPDLPEPTELAQEREQQALAEFISRRWRIADTAASSFVAIAYRAGKEHSVDPVLILAVMAIESRYNPVAESGMGAKGLMQVIPRFHLEKLLHHGGEHALLNPEVNIQVGAQILREYYRRLGDQELALQMYAGAFDDPTAQYANKVFAERARLEPIRQSARKQQSAQSA
jgi:soluble lytic murein transglycosylase-like protein